MYRESAALLDAARARGDPRRARRSGSCGPPRSRSSRSRGRCRGDVRLLIMDEPSAILDESEIEHPLRRRAPAHRRGRRRRLHLAPARRDPAHRQPRDRPRRRPHRRDRAAGDDADRRARRAMVGRKVEQLYPDRPVGTDRVLLDVRDARRLPAVRGVSLQVQGRRGPRARRARRLRPHGAAAADLRPRRRSTRARSSLEGKRLRAGHPRARDRVAGSGSHRRTASRRHSCSTGARRRT